MAHQVFIDGEAGTTGLQILERLEKRQDISLIRLDDSQRKDPTARRDAFAGAEIAILCLPDDAAREAVALAQGTNVRFIDASTAHRIAPDWDYGFPELGENNRIAIAKSSRVSNPGCYSTGAIAILAPLTKAGLIKRDALLSINAVSGYTGGGKAMIAEYESGAAPAHFTYALGQNHKHIPEIIAYGGLDHQPVFSPSVGNFAQGMVVQIPLHLKAMHLTIEQVREAWDAHYANTGFVYVDHSISGDTRIDPTMLNGTNKLALTIQGNKETGCAVAIAVLDNLGKGASGAAIQNLNIMIGADEGEGL